MFIRRLLLCVVFFSFSACQDSNYSKAVEISCLMDKPVINEIYGFKRHWTERMAISQACLDNDEDSRNPTKSLRGSVSLALCLPDLSPCDKNKNAYLTFSHWPREKGGLDARKNRIREKNVKVTRKGGLDVYARDDGGSKYYLSPKGGGFYVICNENIDGEVNFCSMNGVNFDRKIEYRLYYSENHKPESWFVLHESFVDFINKSVSLANDMEISG